MKAWLCIIAVSLLCNSASAYDGFQNPDVRKLLDAYAISNAVSTQDLIDTALGHINNADFVRFFITNKGGLYFMLDESLYAVIVAPVPGGARVLVSSVLDVKSLTKNTSGIVFESESMTGEQARSGEFCFDYFEDPGEGLEMLIGDMVAATTEHAARRPATDVLVAQPRKKMALDILAEVAMSFE